MTTRSPLRILASALRRRPSLAATPHRFYPLNTQSHPTSKPQEAPQN
jgi:hypothetical protein